jgi:hypothetical protein
VCERSGGASPATIHVRQARAREPRGHRPRVGFFVSGGAVGLVVQGITYTTREKVVDVAGVQITAEKQKTIPIPAIAGGLALAGGIAVVVVASRNLRKP